MTRKAKAKPAPAAYEPTPAEQLAVEAYRERKSARGPAANLKITQSGPPNATKAKLEIDHADPSIGWFLIANAFGSAELDFVEGTISNLVTVGGLTTPSDLERGANAALAFVRGVKPRGEVETALAVQMAAIHATSLKIAERMMRTDGLPQFEAYERAYNRLSRTFVAQVEALAKLRNGGKQVVEVKHYDVRGQNVVVGDVHHGGGGGVRDRNPAQPYEPRSIASDPGETIPPLWGQDATGDVVSVSRDAGEEPV